MRIIVSITVILLMISCNGGGSEKEVAVTDTLVTITTPNVIGITKAGENDTIQKSIEAYITKQINDVRFTIYYHSPAVRNRVIWGGLVAFNHVWVTGAHSATSIEFEKRITIDNKKIPAGKYALFTIPSQKEWTVILNRNWKQHLADDYDAKEDVIRVSVKPDTLDYAQERLMYDISQTGENQGNIEIRWEKLKLLVPFRLH